MIKVLLADDHPVVRAGILGVLAESQDIEVVAETDNGQEALRLIEEIRPDIVLLDCRLPGALNGIEVAEQIRKMSNSPRVVALSAFDDHKLVNGMLQAHVAGYVLKQEALERVVETIRTVAHGGQWFSASVAAKIAHWTQDAPTEEGELTERERQALQLLARGYTNAQIAEAMVITERTARFHLENILTKLGVSNRTEAVVIAMQRGWIDPTE